MTNHARNGASREHRVMARMQSAGSIDSLALQFAGPGADARFWSKVRAARTMDCWEWSGSSSGGYGNFFVTKIDGKTILIRAHRWAFLMLRHEEIGGLVLDHLCRNPYCVNPWHLEPVSQTENLRRQRSFNGNKTHCKRGHELSGDNLGVQADGHRHCRACKRMTDARRSAA